MCPYYLDGDLGKSLAAPPGDTRVIGYCAVFKVREEAERDRRRGHVGPDHRQDSKGTRWMPWHQESKKGVNGCDKPRLGA